MTSANVRKTFKKSGFIRNILSVGIRSVELGGTEVTALTAVAHEGIGIMLGEGDISGPDEVADTALPQALPDVSAGIWLRVLVRTTTGTAETGTKDVAWVVHPPWLQLSAVLVAVPCACVTDFRIGKGSEKTFVNLFWLKLKSGVGDNLSGWLSEEFWKGISVVTGFEDVGDDVLVLSCHRLDSSSVTAVRCLKTKALKIKNILLCHLLWRGYKSK